MVLPGAGRADDSDGLARLDGQRQVLDQRLVRLVPERHVGELDPALHPGRPDRCVQVGRLLLGVQQLEYPLG